MAVNDRGEIRPTYGEALAQLTEEERQSFSGAMDAFRAFRNRTGESLSSADMKGILDSIPGSQAAIGKHMRLVFGIKDDAEATRVKEIVDGLLQDEERKEEKVKGPEPAERVEEGEVVE